MYTEELVAALAEDDRDELALYGYQVRRPHPPRSPSIPPGATLYGGGAQSALRAVARRVGAPAPSLGGIDVLHWTDYALLPSRAPIVATVHDVLFDELPDCYTPEMLHGLRDVTRRIAEQAAHIIVPTQRAGAALQQYYDVDDDRVTVVEHGHRPLPEAQPETGRGRYVLCVGTLEPRKNVDRLLRAQASLHAHAPDVRLVVAGPRGWKEEATVAEMERRDDVDYIGQVGPQRLAALYGGALAVAYPSLGEGFGLVAIEAMAHGKALVVGAETTCADIAGDAALAVDPTDEEAIFEALRSLVDDATLCERLGATGREMAAAYTWARAAEQTRAVYAKVLR